MADPVSEVLRVEVGGAVATVTMNRPEARNALNMELKTALAEAFARLRQDNAVRCVVLTGTGGAFSAGGDIGEMDLNDAPVRSRARLQSLLRDVVEPLAGMEKPTIAAVNGHAHGAGLSLALACDFIIASEDALMSCAFSRMGLVPDCGAMYFLPRRISLPLAKELVFTGRRFTAAEAKEMGIVNHVVPADELSGLVRERAGAIAASPTVALGLAKRLLDQSLESSFAQMAELEAFGQAVLYTTQDNAEARRAFAAKSPPQFVGH